MPREGSYKQAQSEDVGFDEDERCFFHDIGLTSTQDRLKKLDSRTEALSRAHRTSRPSTSLAGSSRPTTSSAGSARSLHDRAEGFHFASGPKCGEGPAVKRMLASRVRQFREAVVEEWRDHEVSLVPRPAANQLLDPTQKNFHHHRRPHLTIVVGSDDREISGMPGSKLCIGEGLKKSLVKMRQNLFQRRLNLAVYEKAARDWPVPKLTAEFRRQERKKKKNAAQIFDMPVLPSSRSPSKQKMVCLAPGEGLITDAAMATLRKQSHKRLSMDVGAANKLNTELLAGKAAMGADERGGSIRLVRIGALHLQSPDGKVFVRIGKHKLGRIIADCVLPGAKLEKDQSPGDVVQELLTKELTPIAAGVKISHVMDEETIKESASVHAVTKYIKHVTHAHVLPGYEKELGILSTNVVALQSDSAIDLPPLSGHERIPEHKVFEYGESGSFYSWLPPELFRHLGSPSGKLLLDHWISRIPMHRFYRSCLLDPKG